MPKADIWMPFYVSDYLSDTMHLTPAEHGAYLMLILHYWKSGPLPDDDVRLALISRMGDAWSNASSTLRAFFKQSSGMLVHSRIDREREAASDNKARNQARAVAAASKRWGNDATSNATSIPQAMLNECPSPSPSPSPLSTTTPSTYTSTEVILSEHPLAGATRAKKSAAAKKEPSQTGETWQAYEAAYERRYGVKPVRNAMVNGQIANFVKRVGVDEAPHIAAWFIGHQNRFYVEKGHSVGMLAVDAEKLRTQWATNNAATSTQALQADKTYTNFNVFDKIKRENEIERNRLNANQ